MSKITLHDGQTLSNIHAEADCLLDHCPIHNPSDHPLREAGMIWLDFPSEGTGVLYRVCAHERSHPDPDATDFLFFIGRFILVEAIYSTHISKCDGCCHGTSE